MSHKEIQKVINLRLYGEKVNLKDLTESNVDDFCAWYSDGEVTRFIGIKPLPRNKAKTLFNRMLTESNSVYFGIIKKDEDRIIGYVFLTNIVKSHRVAREFGIVIGEKSLWGCGYGSEATKLILEYGFKHLKLHRIQLIVLDFNERALHMYRKLGFVDEGIQREALIVDGRWSNVVMMSMLEQEYSKNS